MPKHLIRSLSALFVLPFLLACPPDKDEPSARERAIQITNAAKEKIAGKEYSAAKDLCVRAEAVDDTYDEAKYCVVAVNLGSMAETVSDILRLAATQLAPGPVYRPQRVQVKPLVASLLEDIEAGIREIDAYAFKLASMDNPKFHIAEFPLDFDPAELLKAASVDEIKVAGPLTMNLRGTWDMSEVLLLAGALNGVQGVIDYLMAHELVIESTDISFDTTGGVAAFLATNTQLLSGDPQDLARLAGDDAQKGLRNDVVAALSYLVGREADLAGVAPANAGLRAAIKQSALDADPEAVLRWTDADADGIPEKVGVPALEELRREVVDAEGKPVLASSTLDNELSVETWSALIALGEALRDNVEAGGGTPVSLKPALAAIVADMKAEHASTRVLQKNVPDAVAVNPGAFFKSPKYIGELLPYYFSYVTAGSTATRHELALESENFDGADNYVEKMGARYGINGSDFGHFSFVDGDVYSAAFTVASYTFAAFEAAPTPIAADGVKPTAKTPKLVYLALPDPGFGGLLWGDADFAADASGGNYAELTNQSLWKGVNKLLKYYCLDATELGLEMFDDDAAIYAGNKMADCSQALE